MELRHLRYFVAIAEEGSFTRAAERLWVAQPGLSTQIRRLESELGIRLFERHTRGVELTDAGELFLERARTVLTAAEAARRIGGDLETGVVGTVRLGLASVPSWRPSPALLEHFTHARPNIEILLEESYGGALTRDLRDGRLDAMLAPSLFSAPEFESIPLGSQPWMVLAGGAHPLATDGPISAAELGGREFVVTGHRDGASYDRAVGDTLSALGVEPLLRGGGPGPAFLAAVADGSALALTTVPATLERGIVARPLFPVRALGFGLYCRPDKATPALHALIELVNCRPSSERASHGQSELGRLAVAA